MLPEVPSTTAEHVPEGTYVLDVREPEEWAAGRVPGSVHVPLGELAVRLDEVPRDRPVLVVCRVGGRSAHAVAWLCAQGYDAVNLDGGLVAWARAGRQLVRDGERPGTVA